MSRRPPAAPSPAPLGPGWPEQNVLRVNRGVLIDAPLVPTWGAAMWAAVIWPDRRAADGWGRQLLEPAGGGRGYLTNGITAGDVVEFGADYRVQTGRKTFRVVPRRWYGVVLATDPEWLVAHGPHPNPYAAHDFAERALDTWRQSLQVHIPGVTEPGPELPALDAPRPPTAAVSPVELRSDGTMTSVDDPVHGRLLVDAAAFGSAMRHSRDQLLGLLADEGTDSAETPIAGSEPLVTLAALAAQRVPERLAGDEGDVAAPLDDGFYVGYPGGRVERVDTDDIVVLTPPRRWSPDGFAWGHVGDGPNELGYALLADATGSAATAARYAERYAAAVVAGFPPGDTWTVTVASTRVWAHAAEAATPTAEARSAPPPPPAAQPLFRTRGPQPRDQEAAL